MGTVAGTRGTAMGKKRQSHGPSSTLRVLLGPWLCRFLPIAVPRVLIAAPRVPAAVPISPLSSRESSLFSH